MAKNTAVRSDDCATIPVWPDAAKRAGLGKNAMYEAVKRGDFPVLRVGGRILVLRKPFERMLNGEAA